MAKRGPAAVKPMSLGGQIPRVGTPPAVGVGTSQAITSEFIHVRHGSHFIRSIHLHFILFVISTWGSPIINNFTQSVNNSSKFNIFIDPNSSYTLRPQNQQDDDTCVIITSESLLQLGSCNNTVDSQKLWWISECQWGFAIKFSGKTFCSEINEWM